MPFKSDWYALTKASIVVSPILKHLASLGFTPVYTPSLSFTDAIDHKRIRFKAEDLPQEKLSNFPIFAWSRTPVTISQELNQLRRIKVASVTEMNTGTPYPLNYAGASFTLNWMVLFNRLEDFEEFEIVYTTEKLFSDFREFMIYLPALYGFANLSEEERSLYVGTEWEMLSNAELSKLNDYVQFSLTGTAQITFPALSITSIDLPLLKELELNFYSDFDCKEKQESFKFTREFNQHGEVIGGEIRQTYENDQVLWSKLKGKRP